MAGSIGGMEKSIVMGSLNGKPLVGLESLGDGALLEVTAELEPGQAESLILYRHGENVRAWLNICPHAGRRLDWAPGQFLKSREGQLVCAAHGASFELDGGQCVNGPCRGDALRAVPVDVRDGQVWLAQVSDRPRTSG